MYRKLPRSEEDAIAYEVTGKLDEDALDELLTDLETAIADHGTVDLLISVPEAPAPYLEREAFTDDLGFWLRHGDDVGRYAVVGDDRLLEFLTDVSDPMTSTEVEFFHEESLDAAWNWVVNGE
ncbi:hypothetical protein JCM17823_24430 [Halorubrum gandharaense]